MVAEDEVKPSAVKFSMLPVVAVIELTLRSVCIVASVGSLTFKVATLITSKFPVSAVIVFTVKSAGFLRYRGHQGLLL